MKITTQEFENGQAVLHIEVESPEMEKSLDEAYHHLAKKVNIPGFRKGKVPRPVLENYVGKEGLQQEALELLIPQLSSQAAEEQNLEVIAQPQVEVLEFDPVVFKATFPLRPKVNLGDYRSIRLEPEPVEVTDEETDKVLEQIREQNALWVPAERPVQFGDMVTIDLEQSLGAAPPVNYEGQQLPVVQGSPLPLPGFSDELVGMEKDGEKEFSLSFPDDHEVARLAGQSYDFKVKVTEVKEKQLPELDDEFAKTVSQEVETLGALRETVAARLKTAAGDRARMAFEWKVVEATVGMAELEYPPVLIEREIDDLLRERDIALRGQGGLEAYLKNINKAEEEVREELRPKATERLSQALVLSKIGEEEKIEVSAADIDDEIEKMLKDTGDTDPEEVRKLLNTPGGRRSIWEHVIVRKTVQCLTEIAKGIATGEEGADEGTEGDSGGDEDDTHEDTPEEGDTEGEAKEE